MGTILLLKVVKPKVGNSLRVCTWWKFFFGGGVNFLFKCNTHTTHYRHIVIQKDLRRYLDEIKKPGPGGKNMPSLVKHQENLLDTSSQCNTYNALGTVGHLLTKINIFGSLPNIKSLSGLLSSFVPSWQVLLNPFDELHANFCHIVTS